MFYMDTTWIIVSRFYNSGCLFELGCIITISVLLKSFGLNVNSDFTNSSDLKILGGCLFMVLIFLLNN